jgi:MFS transporter, PAT family, beta-lactamase induction signal transducer AmpG
MRRWFAAATQYAEPRVLAVLLLGFSSGIPLALTGQTLSVWMREAGVSLSVVGLFSLVGLPYVLKFAWAPLLDAVRIPFLTRRLGRRRAWLLTTQVALAASVIALGSHDPKAQPLLTAALALLVAFCSATQDIVIDAFRIESLSRSRLAAGLANYVAGYRVALLVATAGAFEIQSRLQTSGLTSGASWGATYAVMGLLVLAGSAAVILSREPADPGAAARMDEPFSRRFRTAVIRPFADFVRRSDWLVILLFVMLFKLGDAMAGLMTAPFVLDIGFDKVEYGRVVKVFGFAATLLGGFAGGYLSRFFGSMRGLWLAAVAQIASNLMFIWLAHTGPELYALVVTIGIENLTSALGTVLFLAYLSEFCDNRAYTATLYALLSALSAVGRTVLSASAGWLAETFGWPGFFLLTTIAALPALVLLRRLSRPEAIVAAPAVAPA